MFKDVYWLRDLASKAIRRVKKTLGRPDPTPWVLRPQKRPDRGAYVDLVVALDFINNTAPLTRLFHDALSPYGLSMLVANKSNCTALTGQLRAGKFKPRVLLDLCSAVHPEFGDLLKAAAQAGAYCIGEPSKLEAWTYKAAAHPRLVEAGLPVPATVIFRAGDASRELTAEERALVGDKCVIKPSWGVAGKGVVANVKPTRENIEAARQFDPKDDYLVQRMVKWERFGNRSAYLRGYNILGTRTLLWWAPESHAYDICTWQDVRTYDLMGAVELMDRLAKVTGMDYFSSEIAITSGVGQPRFVLIDYCNDQCDLNPGTAQQHGPPESWVKWVCERFAEFVWRKKMGASEYAGHAVWMGSRDGGNTGTARMVSAA